MKGNEFFFVCNDASPEVKSYLIENRIPHYIHTNTPEQRKEWYINGKRHRDDDKPAIVNHDGSQSWYQNGKPHREGDLPAAIFADGNKYWYINGNLYKYINGNLYKCAM